MCLVFQDKVFRFKFLVYMQRIIFQLDKFRGIPDLAERVKHCPDIILQLNTVYCQLCSKVPCDLFFDLTELFIFLHGWTEKIPVRTLFMKSNQVVRNIKSFRGGIHSIKLCGSIRIKIIGEYLRYSIALHCLPFHHVYQFFMTEGTLVICLSKQRCVFIFNDIVNPFVWPVYRV